VSGLPEPDQGGDPGGLDPGPVGRRGSGGGQRAHFAAHRRRRTQSLPGTQFCFLSITRSSMVPRSVRFGVKSRKLSNVGRSLDG
jgi:hypothetical protein